VTSTPLQLLWAANPLEAPAHGRLTARHFTSTLAGVVRPQTVEEDGVRFVALTLGGQDLLELASELSRRAGWYPVDVDVRDQSLADADQAATISDYLLESLQSGDEDRAIDYLTGPAEGVMLWAVGLGSPNLPGTVRIDRQGTLRAPGNADDEGKIVSNIVQALLAILMADT
jgi:hypothetical protein